MTYNRMIQVIAVILAVSCFGGAALLGIPISSQREDLELTGKAGKSLPARIALTQAALGSFRGLFVDLLWYRATKLKEAGQYREANQLSEWICALQPHFSRVWVFHAWNMAYNISVATHTKEERWHWVNKGIRLLRDEGLDANPNSVLIKKELAWIFFHKFGGVSDDMHWYYRRRLAQEWQEVLTIPEYYSTEQMIQRMQFIVDAPDTIDQVLEDEQTRKLVMQLKERFGYEPNEQLLRRFGRIFMFMVSPDKNFYDFDEQTIARYADIELYRFHIQKDQIAAGNAYRRLINHLRKRVLLDKYKMDPAEMVRLMKEFGPMDWRHPAAHGVYWATQGIKTALAAREKTSIDQLNTDRLIIHSMQDLMHTGRLTYDPVSDYLHMLPDPRFVAAYEKAMGYAVDRVVSTDFNSGTKDSYNTGHDNFLVQAVTFHYMYGDEQEANRYFERWRKLYGSEFRHRKKIEEKWVMSDLAMNQVKNETRMMQFNTMNFIDAMLYRAFLDGMAQGELDVFNKFFNIAKQLHDEHQETKGREYNPDADRGRLELMPWKLVVPYTYAEILKNRVPGRRIPLNVRARIWRMTHYGLRRMVYDIIAPAIYAEAEQLGRNPSLVLPEPPDMDVYRQQQRGRRDQFEGRRKPQTVKQQ